MKFFKYYKEFLLGALFSLSFPEYFGSIFIAAFAISLFILLLNNCSNKKESLLMGWNFGFGHFVTSLYWIGNALLVDADLFAWLIPFAVILIPSILSLYISVLSFVYVKLNINIYYRIFLFPTLWVISELIRGNVIFGGFPWNPVEHIAAYNIYLEPWASVIGVYGLSWLVIFLSNLPTLFVKYENKKISLYNIHKYRLLLSACLIGVIMIGGINITKPTISENITNLKVRLVQASIPQSLKWDGSKLFEHFKKHLDLSMDNGAVSDADIIVWLEAAIGYYLDREPELQMMIGSVLKKGAIAVVGGVRIQGEEKIEQIWNSIFIINDEGRIVSHYDKQHLVPFGEYIPFRSWLPGVQTISHGMLDFTAGKTDEILNVIVGGKKISLGMLICYEVIFPHSIRDNEGNKPDIIINLTNDTWFGDSIGPKQHNISARMRAIEQGVLLVRSANNGISTLHYSNGQHAETINYNEVKAQDYIVNMQ